MMLWLSLICSSEASRSHVGGYFRVQARPDLQGGSSQLGYWNLYGRLLNEGSYATIDFRHEILERNELQEPWTAILMRVEGGSIGNADSANGALSALRLSQVFVQAGNLGSQNLTWQVGTLENYFGDLEKPKPIWWRKVNFWTRPWLSPHPGAWTYREHPILEKNWGSTKFSESGNFSKIREHGGRIRKRAGVS